MKNTSYFIFCCLFFPAFLTAQCRNFTLPFLTINPNTHYRGLAETGVVTSGDGQAFLPWQQNVALLGSYRGVVTIKSNLVRTKASFSSATPTLYNLNTQIPLVKRLVLGLDASFYSHSQLTFTDANGQFFRKVTPLEYQITGSLGYQLNDHFSLGAGFSFLESNLSGGSLTLNNGSEIQPVRSFAAHLGAHYHGMRKLSEQSKLTFEGGLSINNFGPKVGYVASSDFKDNIPATLKLGGRIGWEGSWKENSSFGISLIAQIDHILIPECSHIDDDNNGLADFKETGIWKGAIQSFGDHSDGFAGEISSMTKRIALHPWIALNSNWKAGLGLGFVQARILSTGGYGTIGATVAYKKIQLELSNTVNVLAYDNFPHQWGFSVGYKNALKAD